MGERTTQRARDGDERRMEYDVIEMAIALPITSLKKLAAHATEDQDTGEAFATRVCS
jgi:hypothetical protein